MAQHHCMAEYRKRLEGPTGKWGLSKMAMQLSAVLVLDDLANQFLFQTSKP